MGEVVPRLQAEGECVMFGSIRRLINCVRTSSVGKKLFHHTAKFFFIPQKEQKIRTSACTRNKECAFLPRKLCEFLIQRPGTSCRWRTATIHPTKVLEKHSRMEIRLANRPKRRTLTNDVSVSRKTFNRHLSILGFGIKPGLTF